MTARFKYYKSLSKYFWNQIIKSYPTYNLQISWLIAVKYVYTFIYIPFERLENYKKKRIFENVYLL